MHSKDNPEKQSSKMANQELLDPFEELFATNSFKRQIDKEKTMDPVKSMDDILFSKIDPLDLTVGKNNQIREKGSIVFEEGELGRDTVAKRDYLPGGLLLNCEKLHKKTESTGSVLARMTNRAMMTKENTSNVHTSDKANQELLSLLSVKADIFPGDPKLLGSLPGSGGLKRMSGTSDGGFDRLGGLAKESLIETPKSPSFDAGSSSSAQKPTTNRHKRGRQVKSPQSAVISYDDINDFDRLIDTYVKGCPAADPKYENLYIKNRCGGKDDMISKGVYQNRTQVTRAQPRTLEMQETPGFGNAYPQQQSCRPITDFNSGYNEERKKPTIIRELNREPRNISFKAQDRYNPQRPLGYMHSMGGMENLGSMRFQPICGPGLSMQFDRQMRMPGQYGIDAMTAHCYSPKPVTSRMSGRSYFLVFKMKLFKLNRISDEQLEMIDKLSRSEENLKYKFFRTIGEVSRILDLPSLNYSETHELRLLSNLLGRYGGYLNANAQFLNYVKAKMSKSLFKYISYVVPLETRGYFYKPRGKKLSGKRKPFRPTKEELNLVLCIGIYDDIFYFLELLEQGEVPGTLISELLNMFFLVSDRLFKRFDNTLFILEKIVRCLSTKPYKTVLDRIPRDLLYQLQEQLFRIILKFEANKRSEQSFNEETLGCILEAILQRKTLKRFPEIIELEAGYGCEPRRSSGIDLPENENIWAMMLIDAVNTVIWPTPKILELLFTGGNVNPGLILRVSSKIHLDRQMVHKLFVKHEAYIVTRLKGHIRTLENKILLNDEKELEIIIMSFLLFIFNSEPPLISLLNTISEYKDHLVARRVYFQKKKSSNIGNIIRYLTNLIAGR